MSQLNTKKGILIIATRSPIYGNMAYNLCMTIKASGSKLPVCLVHDLAAIRHLKEDDLKLFDILQPTEKNWNDIRFSIDEISPFDHTMQLDADMLWLKKQPEELFKKYSAQSFICTNEGYHDIESGIEDLTGNYQWLGDLKTTIKTYNLTGKIYQMRWELLMFKKTKAFNRILLGAKDIRNNPKMKTWQFEGQPVDEFAFYVSACKEGAEMAAAPFLPAYWGRRDYPLWELTATYYAVSFGGNTASPHFMKQYDLIMNGAAYKTGLKHRFQLQSKRDFIPERKII